MIEIFQDIHSLLRYPVLFLLLWSLVDAWLGMIKEGKYSGLSKFLYSITHLILLFQVFTGFVLYIMHEYYWTLGKGWDGRDGFFSDTHLFGMVLAMTVITAGFISSLKTDRDLDAYRRIAFSYTVGTALIFFHIPWPFLQAWANWF